MASGRNNFNYAETLSLTKTERCSTEEKSVFYCTFPFALAIDLLWLGPDPTVFSVSNFSHTAGVTSLVSLLQPRHKIHLQLNNQCYFASKT